MYEAIEVVASIFTTNKRECQILKIRNEFGNDFCHFVNVFKDMKRNSLTIEEIKKGLDAYLNIEANSSYLQSLREQISEAENKNSNLQQEIQGKLNVITGINSQIFAIRKVKNVINPTTQVCPRQNA